MEINLTPVEIIETFLPDFAVVFELRPELIDKVNKDPQCHNSSYLLAHTEVFLRQRLAMIMMEKEPQ